MMVEMGPFRSGASPVTIEANPGSWNEEHGMLFIDNPVGAGYSYVAQQRQPLGFPHPLTLAVTRCTCEHSTNAEPACRQTCLCAPCTSW
jgi:hypothetical protein